MVEFQCLKKPQKIIFLTGASSESKRKEESSEEEEARKEAFTKEARKEAYTKAQSMKSLFQQGQTIKTKRCEEKKSITMSLFQKVKVWL